MITESGDMVWPGSSTQGERSPTDHIADSADCDMSESSCEKKSRKRRSTSPVAAAKAGADAKNDEGYKDAQAQPAKRRPEESPLEFLECPDAQRNLLPVAASDCQRQPSALHALLRLALQCSAEFWPRQRSVA